MCHLVQVNSQGECTRSHLDTPDTPDTPVTPVTPVTVAHTTSYLWLQTKFSFIDLCSVFTHCAKSEENSRTRNISNFIIVNMHYRLNYIMQICSS